MSKQAQAQIGAVRISLGLQSHARLHGDHMRGLVELARHAEQAGLDGVVIGDHVALGNRLDRYPYPPVHFSSDAPWAEPLAVLAAAAAVTSRINLATGVLVAPLRPAVLLAKQAATIDCISGGRLELGVGVGWQPEEFDALGVEFSRRGERLTDAIRACRALWETAPASFSSASVGFEEIWCEPRPARAGGIPILFSGSLHRRNLQRIAELGAGWVTHPGENLARIAAGVETLRRALAECGRDPSALRVRTRLPLVRGASGPDLARSLDAVRDYAAAGVTDLTVWGTSLAERAGQLVERVAALGAAWKARRV
jgi:probable F420-dependent oxidoreductase